MIRKILTALTLTLIVGLFATFIGCNSGPENKTATLSEKDIAELNELRDNLVSAIVNRNPIAYADLCTNDVRLLHPGSPMVSGRKDLIEHVQPVQGRKVTSLVLTPVEIYGIGDLAYEVGTQALTATTIKEGFSSSRKYLHVFRKTENGWRFAALMSSDN